MNLHPPKARPDTPAPQTVWFVDASLFSAPFTYHLCEALVEAGWRVRLYTRPLRPLESQPPSDVQWDTGFYRTAELLLRSPVYLLRRLAWLFKGISHTWGLVRLIRQAEREMPSAIHFVWLTLPLLDQLAIRRLRRTCPVVVTAHNADPLHGRRLPLNGLASYVACYRLADVVSTFTVPVEKALLAWGVQQERIALIGHPPFRQGGATAAPVDKPSSRCVVLMFGVIRRYKGVETLLEAALQVIETTPCLELRIIGRCDVDLSVWKEEIARRGLHVNFVFDPVYVSDDRLAREIAQADVLAFPYLETDASAALSTALGSGKAMVLSEVGLFADLSVAQDARADIFVPPGNAARLGTLLVRLAADRAAYNRNANAMQQLWRDSAGWADVAGVLTRAYRQASSQPAARDHPRS